VRSAVLLLLVAGLVSIAPGQYLETKIPLPDSTSGLTDLSSFLFHSPTSTIYAGGNTRFLIAIDARTDAKLRKVPVGLGPYVLCGDTVNNRVYCANHDATVTVVDAATNQPVDTLWVDQLTTDLVYVGRENRLYCGNGLDTLVRVVDCATDSIVARIRVSAGPAALCYDPARNRLYCAHSATDEVTVIDCAADTVIAAIWVRGVRPGDICFDSATNCVYTSNSGSATVSVIDCAADTLLGLLATGRGPGPIITGPPGKAYCANYTDSSVSVIVGGSVKTIGTGRQPVALCYDAANGKVCCANEADSTITVLDAASDSIVAQLRVGAQPAALCLNPEGDNVYAGCGGGYSRICVINGASGSVDTVVPLGPGRPGEMCYATGNNHLYCLDQSNQMLYVIDGESNEVLKSIVTGSSAAWPEFSPAGNKVYFIDSGGRTVSVLDCASDSIVASIVPGPSPCALRCGDSGDVYVEVDSGVAVIDGSGDSVRAVIPLPMDFSPWPAMCYDRNLRKLYVGNAMRDTAKVYAIDARTDSLVASISTGVYYPAMQSLCCVEKHSRLYVCYPSTNKVAIIDCSDDSVVKQLYVTDRLSLCYNDSACDKVYCFDDWNERLRAINAATETYYRDLSVGYVSAMLDNGRQGPANRLYCVDYSAGKVTIVNVYKTDSILRVISVGGGPENIAWNPFRSRVYVSSYDGSYISVIRDTFGPGVEEMPGAEARAAKSGPTVVRGVLNLPRDMTDAGSVPRPVLLNVAGRKVMDLRPGPNDVSRLSPGVYFVRSGPLAVSRQPSAVTKVVVTK
jgi:DNA-binding beta-propeller fold protein YncE